MSKIIRITIILLIIPGFLLAKGVPSLSKNKLKTCSGNYKSGEKEFKGTYLDEYENGEYFKLRAGVWNFWYLDGNLKFEGIYKNGILVSKKCWDLNGESIHCDLLNIPKSVNLF